MKKEHGFTLIELMVTLIVAVVLLTVAIPSFRGTIQNNRATTIANSLLGALNLARSEAVKRNATVTLCASSNGSSCTTSTNWATGWVMLDNSSNLLRTWNAPDGNPTISGPSAAVQFYGTGGANAAVSYTVTLPNCTGDQKRTITVDATGRAVVTTGSCP